eukprot:Cvel_25648.t1-p1 / transcript=Cvel_25648.t1 / gene=Cvel_25648 / organism=Chromera_velia_CCMP2878 / gene_product=hypothetical protein / transcript_product=hypothetical protein / location=Cvel_scaffold2934:21016-22354(+) / protein_length=410 / sequence_SO=supercontig / SO=protein_coding / is_pseudo=false
MEALASTFRAKVQASHEIHLMQGTSFSTVLKTQMDVLKNAAQWKAVQPDTEGHLEIAMGFANLVKETLKRQVNDFFAANVEAYTQCINDACAAVDSLIAEYISAELGKAQSHSVSQSCESAHVGLMLEERGDEVYLLDQLMEEKEFLTVELSSRNNVKGRGSLDRMFLLDLIHAQHFDLGPPVTLRSTGHTGEITATPFWLRAFLPTMIQSVWQMIYFSERGCAAIPPTALVPSDKDRQWIIKAHLLIWNAHADRDGRGPSQVSFEDVWETGKTKKRPAKAAWTALTRSIADKLKTLRGGGTQYGLDPVNEAHVKEFHRVCLQNKMAREPAWWQLEVQQRVPSAVAFKPQWMTDYGGSAEETQERGEVVSASASVSVPGPVPAKAPAPAKAAAPPPPSQAAQAPAEMNAA